jgi:hypothetical protein
MTKRKTKKHRSMDRLLTYSDFAPYLPTPMTRRQCLAMADIGERFPKYARAYHRAEPVWSENSIVAWITDNFERVAPAYCQRLLEDGLSGPPFHGEPVL